MALPADYHIHTPLCRHAVGEPREYAKQARALGLKEIGFADHSPMQHDDFDDWRMRRDQLHEYVASVQQAQREHPELVIKLGLEVDFLPGQDEWVRTLAAFHPWDYLIGSVHYISDSWAVDNPNQRSNWRNQEPQTIWKTYLDRLNMAAGSGLFDIIGHVDLPKKFGAYAPAQCAPLLERFLMTARENKVAVELNTGGLRKECREIYPSQQVVELMFRHEIPITFGSDAHDPVEVALNFREAIDLARSVGYTHYCQFGRRRRTFLELP